MGEKDEKERMEGIGWGIIGAGDVCEVKSGPGFAKAPGSSLAAIMKRDAAAAEDFARRHGADRWYTDARALIEDPKVDAVYVATPPHLHGRFAVEAMRAGKPVLVEKPMGMSGADCDGMIAASLESGQSLWTAYYRRALDKFITIRRTIEEGGIGAVRSVLIELSWGRPGRPGPAEGENWRVNPAAAGAGLAADLGSHILDLMDWFFGPVTVLSAQAMNRAGDYAAEDQVGAIFLAGGSASGGGKGATVSGTALWDFSGAYAADRTVIRGSEGAVEYSTFDDTPAKLHLGGEVHEIEHRPAPLHVHQPLIERINSEIRGGEAAPSTGISGARTNRALDALVAGYYAR